LYLLLLLLLLWRAKPESPRDGFGAGDFDVCFDDSFYLRRIQYEVAMLALRGGCESGAPIVENGYRAGFG
jgi:hypothetical protein